MKRTIITLLIAVVSFAELSAQSTFKKPTYVIDGQKVENFDGSQLVGKKITAYHIVAESNVHVIMTSEFNDGKPVGSIKVYSTDEGTKIQSFSEPKTYSTKLKPGEMVTVVDGKVIANDEFMKMSSSQIKSMEVIKDKDNAAFKKYAKEGTVVVLIATTK